MPSRWKTSGLSGSRRARRRARASAMGCEIGRIRPTNVFERAGESWRTRPAHHQAHRRPRRATPPPRPHPRTCPRKPPTPPRVAPGAGTGRARLGWGPMSSYAALAADRTGGTGRAAGGRGSRLTDHRRGGASASHAGRGHRGSRPPTHRPRRETDPCGRARERGPRRGGPVADGAATATETPASPLRSACS